MSQRDMSKLTGDFSTWARVADVKPRVVPVAHGMEVELYKDGSIMLKRMARKERGNYKKEKYFLMSALQVAALRELLVKEAER